MIRILISSMILSSGWSLTPDCGPATAPARRLEQGSCEMAMKTAKCEEAAKTDAGLREHYRDCARERTWHLTGDTLLGCASGMGEAVLPAFRALIGGAASFYDEIANGGARRAEAVRTCFTSSECREKIAAQARQSSEGHVSLADFEKTWLRAQRASLQERVELQRRSLETQRDLIQKGLKPGVPGYEDALDRATPEVAAYIRKTADPNVRQGAPIVELVKAKANQLYLHTQCLDQRAATELICYAAMLVGFPGEAAAYLAAAKVLPKILPRAKSAAAKAEVKPLAPAASPRPREAAPEPKAPTPAPAPTPAAVAPEAARGIVVHPPHSKPLGDLRPAELQRIQTQVDNANLDIYVVGSAAKGSRRNVDTDLPLADFGKSKKNTKSDIDYVVKDGKDDLATGLGLPDMDASFGVRGVDSINLKNSPAIHFRPHQPPVYIEGTERLQLH